MTGFGQLEFLDATAQAESVRKREVQPIELVDAAIERIERLNPRLNAVVVKLYEQARAQAAADLPDGPFRGVPFLLKDLLGFLGGIPCTSGSALLKDFVPDQDSELVARYKRAGLIILGKTNTSELGILPTAEPRLFGPVHNPWNLDRTTGGSSGGSAAAVASGMVAMAHGNDGGGSIRIPASCCGLFGLKPTRARNSLSPSIGDIMGGLVAEHVLTRSVRDSAALLDATAGFVPGDPYAAPPPVRPFLAEVVASPGKLRIAVMKRTFTGTPLAQDCIRAVDDAATLCASLGHEVVEDSPPVNGPSMFGSFVSVWITGAAAQIDAVGARLRSKPSPELLEPLTWSMYQAGKLVTGAEYVVAQTNLQAAGRQIARFMERYDAWLTPTLGSPPVPLGTFDTPDYALGMARAAEFVPFTPVANITGQPAMSVPLYWNDDGLPIGTHFFGRFGDEATLFRLAGQLEGARPWGNRRPPLS
jgi:amidase